MNSTMNEVSFDTKQDQVPPMAGRHLAALIALEVMRELERLSREAPEEGQKLLRNAFEHVYNALPAKLPPAAAVSAVLLIEYGRHFGNWKAMIDCLSEQLRKQGFEIDMQPDRLFVGVRHE